MKDLVKISLVALAFFVVSCNKEVIRPNTPTTNNVEQAEEGIVSKSATNNNTGDASTPNGDPGITDPNNDPDMIIKKAIVIKSN